MTKHPNVEPLAVKTKKAPSEALDLQDRLDDAQGIVVVVVAGPPQQLHNLAIATKNKKKKETPQQTQRTWFDLVVVDEASQIDVAESVLVVSKATDGAVFVLAGDDKQLPPIQRRRRPRASTRPWAPSTDTSVTTTAWTTSPLQVNYRANSTLVDFTKLAGYDPGLHARHPDLRLAFLDGGPPNERPADWPNELYWTPEWGRLLDPGKPAVCFVYEDEVASQANDFEADAVATILRLLYGSLDRQLTGELSEDTAQAPWAAIRPHRAPTTTYHASRSQG